MMKILEKNLAGLTASDPDLAEEIRRAEPPEGCQLLETRTGDTTLVIGGVTLHSRFDPWAEARKWAASATAAGGGEAGGRFTVFGFGLGYHILALAESASRITVIEPEAGTIRLAFEHLDFTGVLPRLRIIIGQPAPGDPGPGVPLPYAPSARLYPGEYRETTRRLEEPAPEKRSQMEEILAGVSGLGPVLSEFDSESPVSLKELTGAITKRRGSITAGEIFVLLINEMAG